MSIEINIVNNAITAKVLNPPKEVKILINEALSYYVKGYENTDAYKYGRWDGRSTMFNWEHCTFPVGFKKLINAILYKNGYKVVNLHKPLPAPLGELPETLGGFSYTERYDYQWSGIKALEERGIMISRFATGAGKTFHAALAIARINRPTLILTKRQPLLYQFHERMTNFGFTPGIIGDSNMEINENLTIAMSQTLSKRLEEDTDEGQFVREYLKKVEFIIGEEVHEISDSSYFNVINNCPNSYYRLGLTATPFMLDNSESNMALMGAFGPVGMEVSEKTLIERGINAKPYFLFADYERNPIVRYGSNYMKAVHEGITNCEGRNQKIVEYSKKAKAHGLSTLILIQRQNHGRILLSKLESAGLKAEFIYGESDSEERSLRLKQLQKGEIDVLIGSKIVDVGIDVPSIGLIIMAGGGKAEVSYRQRIGRGLREKKHGPNVCFILDFADTHNRILEDHYKERKRVIMNTEGFAENLLEHDFDWSVFSGFSDVR